MLVSYEYGSHKVPGESRKHHHYIIINFVLNRTEHPLSTVHVPCHALCILRSCESLINVKEEKDAIPQVIFIMAYGSMPYVGMTPKKMAATLKVHK